MLTAVASPKEKMVNVRLSPSVHEDFKVACELKGASMSSLLHQFIVRTIWEEKDRHPAAFKPIDKGKVLKGTIRLTDGLKEPRRRAK